MGGVLRWNTVERVAHGNGRWLGGIVIVVQRPDRVMGRWMRVLIAVGLVAGWVGHGCGQAAPTVIHDADAYFPDEPGNEWRYRGRIAEGAVDRVRDAAFVNVSTVTGHTNKDGVTVVVFHDTNPGNQAPVDSYYLRDVAGIRYYGSKPGTILERQLVPYQIVRFPLEAPGSFRQLDRKHLNLGLDLDHDTRAETVDVEATVTVHGREAVTVPLGTYDDAIRLESSMRLLVHLSRDGTAVHGLDTMTAWFVKDIGLVKYVERQMVPTREAGRERMIEITEELEGAVLQGGNVRLGRRHSSRERSTAPAGSWSRHGMGFAGSRASLKHGPLKRATAR